MGPGANDEYISEASRKDYEQGWSSPPLTWDALRKQTRGRPINLIRRFAISQSNGKKRIIDDAAEGGQSETSEDANKVQFCSATQPAKHVAALTEAAKECKLQGMEKRALESGGEDWPDAYRGTPMDPAHSEACVVVYWHPVWNEAAFQIYHSMLFGLPLAVTGFNRYPKMCQAIVRRFLFILFSMYFDDATIQDWAATKGSGQKEVRKLMKILGTPFAPRKQQDMAVTGDFLGLVHDLTHATSSGLVKFWVRKSLTIKLQGMMQTARDTLQLSPGAASKFYGTANFFECGTFGKIGRAGLNAVKERQYSTDKDLTEGIDKGFRLIEAAIKQRPVRCIFVTPPDVLRFTGASDAAYDDCRGSGGFLLALLDCPGQQARLGRYTQITSDVYAKWKPCKTYIAQLELLMVYLALIVFAEHFRGRRGIWFIDNIAALMALVRGRSRHEDLDNLAGAIHAAMFSLEVWIYFEWVESKANWSDGISREGPEDLWSTQNGFAIAPTLFPAALLDLPFGAVTSLFAFL